MGIPFPSDEWVKELSRQLNESPAYERSGKGWEGDFVFFVEADAVYPHTTRLYIDFFHGKSPKSMMLAEGEAVASKYIVSSSYSNWRKVIEGRLDPIQGMMTGKLKLKGDLLQIMRYPKAVKDMVDACTRIPTDFQA